MNKKLLKSGLLLFALCTSFSAIADDTGKNWWFNWSHYGTYTAELDLNPLGIPRIEAMSLVLHRDGTVNFVSEHEPSDLSSSGVGVWERLSRNKVGIGILMYRMSEQDVPTVCGNIMVFNPENCVLKLGTKVRRVSPGVYSGVMLLTIDGPRKPDEEQISVTIEVELPFTMQRVGLADFPGAL